MMNNKLKTKKDYFSQLDETLSEKDKQAIIESKDLIDFHYSLGMWIRNNWLYERSAEEIDSLCKAFKLDSLIFEPDDVSMEIIEAYRKYLRRKNKSL